LGDWHWRVGRLGVRQCHSGSSPPATIKLTQQRAALADYEALVAADVEQGWAGIAVAPVGSVVNL
jgi:hypothetical protein